MKNKKEKKPETQEAPLPFDNIDDIFLQIQKDDEAIQVTKPGISIKRNVGKDYFIPRERIKTHSDILGWSFHLCGKGWMTQARLRVFIEKAAFMNGFPVPNP